MQKLRDASAKVIQSFLMSGHPNALSSKRIKILIKFGVVYLYQSRLANFIMPWTCQKQHFILHEEATGLHFLTSYRAKWWYITQYLISTSCTNFYIRAWYLRGTNLKSQTENWPSSLRFSRFSSVPSYKYRGNISN